MVETRSQTKRKDMDFSSDPFHDTTLGTNSNHSTPQRETPQRDQTDTWEKLSLEEFNKKLTPQEIERAYQDPRV